MNSEHTSVIALIGISAHEMRVMQTICLISRSRGQHYVLQDDEPSSQADIVIVDRDKPDAMAELKRMQRENQMLPVIRLTRRPVEDPSLYQLTRPLMASRLLKLLDQIPRTRESPAFVSSRAAAKSPAGDAEVKQTGGRSGADKQAVARDTSALVVDDSLPVRQQIKQQLAPLVGSVDLAEDGEQALRFITTRSYDIVFLDVVLPGMDGYKICREIKRSKSTRHTPVIMLTGKSSPFDLVKGKLAGCDTYLTKPVDGTTFNEVVKKYLTKSAANDFGGERNDLANGVP